MWESETRLFHGVFQSLLLASSALRSKGIVGIQFYILYLTIIFVSAGLITEFALCFLYPKKIKRGESQNQACPQDGTKRFQKRDLLWFQIILLFLSRTEEENNVKMVQVTSNS